MKFSFETSFASLPNKNAIIVELHNGNQIGYGECSALKLPLYSEESVIGAYPLMVEGIAPYILKQKSYAHPDHLDEALRWIRKNHFAKAAFNCALWDLYGQQLQLPVYQVLGGVYETIDAGMSIGIQTDIDALLAFVEQSLKSGYRRIKMKIKPGKDYEYVKAVVTNYPDIPVSVDANSAYQLSDVDLFKKLDAFHLLMIEQPLAHDDIIDHATLQHQIKTPICLDESIHCAEDARKAIQLGACGVINIKVGRVGGLSEAKKVHDVCQANDIPVWCGGMLDLGVARSANIAISALSNFTLAHDIVPSNHYFDKDIIDPPVTMNDGRINQFSGPGLGIHVDEEYLEKITVRKAEIAD